MIDCLQKQKNCYVQLLKVAQRQQKAIDEKNDPDILKALQDKNPLLQTLQTLDAEMQPVLKNLSESDRALLIQKGKTLKDEAAQTLEQLIAVEEACAKILKDKKDDTFEQIKVFQERKKGLKGYGQSGGKSSRFSQEG
ncbi:MAG: flagellar protein FlgN [Nitrospinota bacterium]|nr:flagellar protein FlgN [Nitrospinota bacterium]